MTARQKLALASSAALFAMVLTATQALVAPPAAAQGQQPNLIFFVPDGLRALSVTPQTAPTMAAVRDQGVNFTNSHSLFPTFTMANSSGFSTGHYLGDTGVFSNTIYSGYALSTAGNSVTPFIESDAVLGDVDKHFGGSFIGEETILATARRAGFSTAAIGKIGPTLLFDHTERTGEQTTVVDDATGTGGGIPLSQEVKDRLTALNIALAAPTRGDNGKAGDNKTPGTTIANAVQQDYFADVAAKAVLPLFKARNKPFVLVFWSRDPDGTQHNQGDSLLSLTPGINGPTSLAAVRNADNNLKKLRDALRELGLLENTNIVIAADHGFSTISKQSDTSPAAKASYSDVPQGLLPVGFVALDLAKALSLPLYDPDNKNGKVGDGAHPARGDALIGNDPDKPEIIVAANGGSNLLYLPGKDHAFATRVVEALLAQDYVSGLFVQDALGPIPGTLPMSAINMKGSAKTPHPDIVVNFRSFTTGCDQPTMCTAEVADTGLQQGQGMHGTFSRADTMNFMAAAGPSFKRGFVSDAPASNADIGKTLSHVLGLKAPFGGSLMGRVLDEALPGGAAANVEPFALRSEPGLNGLVTLLVGQRVGHLAYFDAAGFPGRTVGLEERKHADAAKP